MIATRFRYAGVNRHLSLDGRKWADISECGTYRYLLGRGWDASLPTMTVIGINPSTADHEKDDPTATRCVGFAKDAGFGGLEMLNPFAFRTKDVRALAVVADPVGPWNDAILRDVCGVSSCVVWASGPPTKVPPRLRARLVQLPAQLRAAGVRLHALAFCKDGSPSHPLMLPKSCRPVVWP